MSKSQNDDTANWKTYTNTKYGYSFNYPLNWDLDVSDNSQDHVYLRNNDSTISFSNIDGVGISKGDLTTVASKWRQGSQIQTSINGLNAIEVKIPKEQFTNAGGSPKDEDVYFVRNENNATFLIQLDSLDISTVTPIFNQTLATFKFIP